MSPVSKDSVAELLSKSKQLENSGQIGAALRKAKIALSQARAHKNPGEIALTLQRMARLHFRQGRYVRTRHLAREALKYADDESPTRAEAYILLGLCAAETDDPTSAEEYFHQAIDLSRQIDYPRGLMRALHNLSATIYVPRGQFALALAADTESLQLARRHRMDDAIWFPLATMGWVYWTTGQWERAQTTVNELKSVAIPGSLADGFACCLLADLAQDTGESQSVISLYARARSIAEAIGDPGLGALARLGLSRYYLKGEDFPTATEWAEDALSLAHRVGYRHLQGMALISKARAHWRNGDISQALNNLSAAIEAFSSVNAHYDLAQAYLLLAVLYHQQSHPKAELTWLEAVNRIISSGYEFLLERERKLAFPLLASYLNHPDPEVAALSGRLVKQLEQVAPPALVIQTLGDFTVRQGLRTISSSEWRARRAGELFRMLLLAPNRSLLREQVIENLWPGKSPNASLPLFHRTTSTLRRILEPDLPDKFPSRYLSVEGGMVALNLPPGSQVDFEIFEELIANQEWARALELFHGPLFPLDRYTDWSAAKREYLNCLAVKASVGLASQALENNNPSLALELCQFALEIDPWQEQAVLLGMRAHVAMNNRLAAIRLYRKLVHVLEQELDIAPQEELQTYYHSLL